MCRPQKILKSLLKNIVRSALFVGVFVASMRFTICHIKNYRGKMDRWNLLAASFVCSFALLIEPKSRMSEITMFVLPRVLESIWTLQVRAGRVKSLKYGQELVFSVCMAVLMYCYENNSAMIKPSYRSLLKKFFGEN